MRKLFLVVLGAITFGLANAQEGFLRGKVTEAATAEGLFGATITKLGTTQGAVADFDGNYSLALEPGIHDIVIQFVSFQPITVEGIEIMAGEVTTLDAPLSEDVQELQSVVVTANQIKDSDAGILAVQKKSGNTIDGISSSSFRKIGDSNLSGAMKRVTGVTVQDGKYVYVRGLGDRYTKTALNGMIVPGLDPDRNDVQIDIFPTGILENVIVYKTFTPNLNGDFAGGLVNIETKSFPEEKQTSLSLGFGFNPDMHLNTNALSYKGSSTDILGFDSGTRDLPISGNVVIPTSPDASVAAATRLFSPDLGVERGTNFMNTSMSFVHRNQVQRSKMTWGYNVIFNYKNTNTYYENFTRKRYERDRTSAELSLERDYTGRGDLSSNNVLWSGLVGLAAKTDNFTIGTNFLHTQNGQSTAMERTLNFTALNNPTKIHNDILAYTERSMTNNITYGKHHFGRLRLDWTNSLLFSKIEDPDYRDTRINEDDGEFAFKNGGSIDRFWRSLNEVSESFKVDFTYPLGESGKLKFGGLTTIRNRDFEVHSFNYAPVEVFKVDENDADWLLQEDNLYSADNTSGLYIQDNSNDFNNYEGQQKIYAGYAMHEAQLTERLKSTYGLRVEGVQMYYSGIRLREDNSTQVENNTKTLDELNLLPSVGFVFEAIDNMNVRASFNKTVARPSFKEKSSAFIEDPITRTRFSGNLDLKQAEVLNYDVRWEFFMTPTEKLSASIFYKDFTNHIALVFFPNSPGQIKPRNVGEASVYGTELEFRKNLDFINPSLYNFSIGANVSFVFSQVNRETVSVNEEGQSEYESEVAYLGSEKGVKKFREMTGQSPYVVNSFINYDNDEKGISGNMSYNVQGETLTFIGTSNVPSVYTKPFKSLNMNVSKSFGAERNSTVSLKVQNILNDNNTQVYKSGSEYKLFSVFEPGRTFTVKYAYSF
ncbi:MAG: TonB-dependent receptor [Cyclobacteriaceae bacterium]